NPSLDRTEGGLGLGLTLVRKLVELHGGTVAAISEGRGRGTEFIVRLPLSAGVRPRVLPQAPTARGSAARLRVLLVDDNQDLRESTGELLRILEHDVIEAADGNEAVRQAQDQPFDVALVDLGLPGLDGYAVAQTLRSMEGPEHRMTL